MKIVRIKCGLGNQMFQYAFAKILARATGEEVKLDLSAFEKVNDRIRKPRLLNFNLALPIASKEEISRLCLLKHEGNSMSKVYQIKIIAEGLLNRKYCLKQKPTLCSLDDMKKYSFFDGYWQDWAMVDSVMSELNIDFSSIKEISEKSKEKLEHINSVNSVFLGVRRGDYLKCVSKFGTFGQRYYAKAMEIIAEKVDNPVFFIFSDDIKWVKENMKFPKYNTVYITDTVDDFEDYILMSNCKHSILSNSTYQWWGARRNEYPGKIVVAPKNWFADGTPINIVPDRWIKIENIQ